MNNDRELYAYALGYYHGRSDGVGKDCFADEADILRHLYQRGYEAGVNDYCGLDMEEGNK